MIYSIGHVNPYGDDHDEPTEHVRVEAADQASPVTRLIDTGNSSALAMAREEIERIRERGDIPTPAAIALGILGGGATVNQAASTR